jgi:hypothetical protein
MGGKKTIISQAFWMGGDMAKNLFSRKNPILHRPLW